MLGDASPSKTGREQRKKGKFHQSILCVNMDLELRQLPVNIELDILGNAGAIGSFNDSSDTSGQSHGKNCQKMGPLQLPSDPYLRCQALVCVVVARRRGCQALICGEFLI